MRQFEDTPFGPDDYSDVALLVAAVREWPSEEFGRELDSRVARRFEPIASSSAAKTRRADQCGKGKELHGGPRRAFFVAGGRCAKGNGARSGD